tara:strand:- start:137 stop:862 length:726 start_codon:yes stop_codon:yes gene_type:complete
MTKIRLGVNIDHVATIRNARGEYYPEPLRAALIAQKSGADSVTIHLREDRRHIRDFDLKSLKKKINIPINLEIAPTREMLKIAIKTKPNYVCIVPEKRKEITTEGGLNLTRTGPYIRHIIRKLKKNGIRVSLFIEPKNNDIKIAKLLGVDCVELHTGKFSKLVLKNKNTNSILKVFKKCVTYAVNAGLEVHAGHGLTYKSAIIISKIKNISELNIGHFIISESIFFSLENVIKKFKKIINE